MRLRSTQAGRGFTVLEVVITLAVLSIVFGFAAINTRPPAARAVSSEFRNVMQQARFEAVRVNRPVAVVWLEGPRQLVTRSQSAADEASICDNIAGQIIVADFTRYPRVAIVPDLGVDAALVWLPSGQARTCTLAPMPNDRIAQIEDDREAFDVTVSVAGLVTRERR